MGKHLAPVIPLRQRPVTVVVAERKQVPAEPSWTPEPRTLTPAEAWAERVTADCVARRALRNPA